MAVVAGLLREEKQAVRLVELGLAVDLKLGARLAGEVNYKFQGETVDLVKKLEIPALYRVELLGRTKSEEAISELEKALNDSDEWVRRSAAKALGNIGSEKGIKNLEKALNDSKSWTHEAIKALGNIGSDKAIESLETALNDSNENVRQEVIKALGNIGSEKAIESLETALNHFSWMVRHRAVSELGTICSDKVVESLETALNDFSWVVRRNAIEALGKIGSDKAVESLENALNDSNEFISAEFSLSNPQQLKQAIQQLITQNIVSKYQENDYGILYHFKGELNSVNDEKLAMITVWLKRKIDQKIQLISLKIISDYD